MLTFGRLLYLGIDVDNDIYVDVAAIYILAIDTDIDISIDFLVDY